MHDIYYSSVADAAKVEQSFPGSLQHRIYSALCRHYITSIDGEHASSTKCVLVSIDASTQIDDICSLFAIAARDKMTYLIAFVAEGKDGAKKMNDIRSAVEECINNDPVLEHWGGITVFNEAAAFVRW